MGKRFQGSTEQAGGSFLGSDFWKKGTRIEGLVTGSFETGNGRAYSVTLTKEVTVGDKKEDKISIGGLKGFNMALRAAGVPDSELEANDMIIVECTGFTKSDKPGYSDQINFKVLVDRP